MPKRKSIESKDSASKKSKISKDPVGIISEIPELIPDLSKLIHNYSGGSCNYITNKTGYCFSNQNPRVPEGLEPADFKQCRFIWPYC